MVDSVTYPNMPGWKGTKSTGRAAAFAVAKDLGRRHRQVIEAFAEFGADGGTCDEVGEALELPVYLVRPRASELERKGQLFLVGKRPGSFGHPVSVYSVVKPRPAAEAA